MNKDAFYITLIIAIIITSGLCMVGLDNDSTKDNLKKGNEQGYAKGYSAGLYAMAKSQVCATKQGIIAIKVDSSDGSVLPETYTVVTCPDKSTETK